jgi:hypothetical protein
MKIKKTAKEEIYVPDPNTLATMVESLKVSLRDNEDIPQEEKFLIKNLPTPRVVRSSLSDSEIAVVFKTVNYLWKKLTGQEFDDTIGVEKHRQPLLGSYWLLRNGILLEGVNHFGIIKNNSIFMITLLGINGMTLQHYMHQDINKLLSFIIMNGGVRMLVTSENKAYFQMSESTYAKWGKKKVKSFDFQSKTVKIIDSKVKYKGWNSGIAIKL